LILGFSSPLSVTGRTYIHTYMIYNVQHSQAKLESKVRVIHRLYVQRASHCWQKHEGKSLSIVTWLSAIYHWC